jgi:glycerol uptake facilitator-like aquaporin
LTDSGPRHRPAAEFLGSVGLAAIVVGSGIAAQQLSPSDTGLQLLENALATALGLTVLILVLAHISGAQFNPVRAGHAALIAPAVGAYIGAAYFFTSSTSFANPAITIGRAFTDTFAGIAPSSVPGYILAQGIGALVGLLVLRSVLGVRERRSLTASAATVESLGSP